MWTCGIACAPEGSRQVFFWHLDMKPRTTDRPWWIERGGHEISMMTDVGPFSVYDVSRVFTGRGWDAQGASLLLRRTAPRRILLLGLGGGTVARQCRALFPEAAICAVEVDAHVIEIAYREFGLASCDVHVVQDRAENFLRASRGRFDAVVDDAWPAERGDFRSAWHDDDWARRWRSRLSHNGMFAVNLYARHKDPIAHGRMRTVLGRTFGHLREIGIPGRLTTVLTAGDELRGGHEASRILRGPTMRHFPELSALRLRSY